MINFENSTNGSLLKKLFWPAWTLGHTYTTRKWNNKSPNSNSIYVTLTWADYIGSLLEHLAS